MELLSDVGNVESRFSPFGDSVSVGAWKLHGLHQTYHMLRNHFGHTQWYFMGMRLKWKLDSVCLDIVLILAQDRCTVCSERTIDSEIVLDTPDGTPWWCGSCGISLLSVWRQCWCRLGDVGYVESHFILFGDSVSVSARLVHGLRYTYHRLRSRFRRTRWCH